MLLYTRLAPPKIPKKRSRQGCSYCKEKKKKCDETRPQCARCAERDQECVYETVKPRQRRRRDSVRGSIIGDNAVDGRPSADASSHTTGRRLSSGDAFERWLDGGHEASDASSPDEMDELLASPLDETSLFAFSPGGFSQALMSPLSPISSSMRLGTIDDGEEDVEELVRYDLSLVPSMSTTTTISSIASTPSSRHPSLAMIAPVPMASPRLDFVHPAFSEFSDLPHRRALIDHFCNVLSHLIVFREESGNPFQQLVLPLCHRSEACMNAIYALASAHREYRGLEPGGASGCGRVAGASEKSLAFHSKAIQGLARLIEQQDERARRASRNELLATIMLLVYYEVLVQQGRSNIVDGHLKGAMAIMSGLPEERDPTSVFLERAFRFYDVIAALSFGTAPLSTAPAAGCLIPFPPLDAPPASPLSNVDTLLGMATTLWPIIHRLSNLLSLKRELQSAVAMCQSSSKVAVLRTEFETTASAIQVALEQWQPCLPRNFSVDDDQNVVPINSDEEKAVGERARLQSILNNALAYRHSAFVYLHRTIHERPRHDIRVQRHAKASLTHCAATIAHAGPMGALLWPLFVAACEAIGPAERETAAHAFVALDRRQGMTNIGRAWDIVQEVWRRADSLDGVEKQTFLGNGDQRLNGMEEGVFSAFKGADYGVDLWRRVSRDMGVTIVFG